MNTSFREMLRDRVPSTVGSALKWCKAKERWLDHVYYSFINIYVSKDERYKATKIVLVIKENHIDFDFHNTIDWDNLTEKETKYWNNIESWVKWFCKNMQYVQCTYDSSKRAGKNKDDIIQDIINDYTCACVPEIQESLATFLYEYISGE